MLLAVVVVWVVMVWGNGFFFSSPFAHFCEFPHKHDVWCALSTGGLGRWWWGGGGGRTRAMDGGGAAM